MSEPKQNHPLSEEAFINKARLYVGQMNEQPPDSWQQGLWAALSLELLARATLAHTSPTLLVPAQKWENLLYALGKRDTPVGPMSITTREVLHRLDTLYPELRGDTLNAIKQIIHLRNSELHSGNAAFVSEYGGQSLHNRFYFACSKLLESMGRQISDIFPNPQVIEQAANSVQDAAAKSVLGDINSFKIKWSKKPKDQRERLAAEAADWVLRSAGHVVCCPSCNSRSILQGDELMPARTEIDTDTNDIIVRKTMLPASFECIACGLKITGYSRLVTCNLGSHFTKKTVLESSRYFGRYSEDEIWEYFRNIEAKPVNWTDFNE